eukprot:scaffold5613_cov133-Isochrysis_galbana.AAC.5
MGGCRVQANLTRAAGKGYLWLPRSRREGNGPMSHGAHPCRRGRTAEGEVHHQDAKAEPPREELGHGIGRLLLVPPLLLGLLLSFAGHHLLNPHAGAARDRGQSAYASSLARGLAQPSPRAAPPFSADSISGTLLQTPPRSVTSPQAPRPFLVPSKSAARKTAHVDAWRGWSTPG